MKTLKYGLKYFVLLLITAILFSCSKEETAVTPDPKAEEKPDEEQPKEEEPENKPPNAFELIGVTDGAIGVDVLPSFSWQDSEDPDGDTVSYDLFLETEEQLENPFKENLPETKFEIEERLDLNQEYFWKVVAKDDNENTAETEVFQFVTRGLRGELVTDNPSFDKRIYHSSMVFRGEIYIIGGGFLENNGYNQYDDVWRSRDGVQWSKVLDNAPFGKRMGHGSVIFQDKIWILGGARTNDLGNSDVLKDVWNSSDGKTWTPTLNQLPISVLPDFATTIVFDNKIWIIGRAEDNNEIIEIWYCSDGENWAKVESNIPFTSETYLKSFKFQEKLWVISVGYNNSSKTIWNSPDGITWSEVSASIPITDRYYFTTEIFDDKIWIIGGYDTNDFIPHEDALWYSSDGINWNEEVVEDFEGIAEHTSLVYKDKLWILAGYGSSEINDVWAFD